MKPNAKIHYRVDSKFLLPILLLPLIKRLFFEVIELSILKLVDTAMGQKSISKLTNKYHLLFCSVQNLRSKFCPI